jgi:hypothetical protein
VHVCSFYFLPVAETNVAPVVYSEGRLNDDVFTHMSQQLFQSEMSLRRKGFEGCVRVFWESVVVLVTPAPRVEARCLEFGSESVVATLYRRSVLKRDIEHMYNASDSYSMPDTILSYCSPLGVWFN